MATGYAADRGMKNLPNDEWIKSNGIFPPGHPHAPPTAGLVFWRLIDQTFQKVLAIVSII